MTPKQTEEYFKRYNIDDFVCQNCGSPATQIAHRISKSKANYRKYGKKIIDSNINLVSVCCLYCNDMFNIGASNVKTERLVELIQNSGKSFLESKDVTMYIEG